MEEHGARAMDEASQTGVQTQSGTAETTRFCMKTCKLRKFWIDHYIAKTDFLITLQIFVLICCCVLMLCLCLVYIFCLTIIYLSSAKDVVLFNALIV